MKSQVLHTVWCYISGEAAGEIWHWSLLGVKEFSVINTANERGMNAVATKYFYPRDIYSHIKWH